MTTETDRALKSRPAYRGQITKLTHKAEEIICSDEPLSSKNRITLLATIDSIKSKLKHIKTLDQVISNSLLQTDDGKFERSIEEADDYENSINESVFKYQTFLADHEAANQLDTSLSSATSSTSSSTSRKKVNLPKLSLTPFSGDILKWQGFKDGFDAAVDKDDGLDEIQKFQYLRTYLIGDAASAIEGLSLTNGNYTHALEILTKRYGQKHKIIAAYMTALWKLPEPSISISSLTSFHDSLESYIRGLKALGKTEDAFGDLLVPIILEKLPPSVRQQISRENGDAAWTIGKLREAIRKEIDAMQAGDSLSNISLDTPATGAFLTSTKPDRQATQQKARQRKHQKPTFKCAFCKEDHKATSCDKVTSKSARRDIVQRGRLCVNCLSSSHGVDGCRSRYTCAECKERHHTSLCLGKRPEVPNNQVHACHASDTRINRNPVLLKTAVTNIYSGPNSTPATILFDEGAQRSFITESAVEKLQIRSNETEIINITAFGAKTDGSRSLKVANVTLRDYLTHKDIPIRALVVPDITAPMENLVKPEIASQPYLQGLTLAHPPSDGEFLEISLLIGADLYWNIVGNHIVRGNGPTAVSSKLGYLLSGQSGQPSQQSRSQMLNVKVLKCAVTSPLAPNIGHDSEDNQLQKFWDLESIGIRDDPCTCDTPLTYDSYAETHLRIEDGRYVAKLPWKPEHTPLPTNHAVAEKRTKSMVRRLTPESRVTYDKIIKDQVQRGFIEQVHHDDVSQGHYLPHRGVKKDSVTTPLRIVYDCSAKVGRNPSLNDCLETGPPLLNDLASILIRFRLPKYAFTADIEKAFLHVGLDEADRDFAKFMWISNPNDPESEMTVYRFKAVLFGAVCSPFILNATVRSHLDAHDSETARDIKDNIYVDNVISGCDETDTALAYYGEANMLTKTSGFNLRDWSTNNPVLETHARGQNTLGKDSTVNVLGLRWDTTEDRISYQTGILSDSFSSLTTKRQVVRITSGLYDPLGYVSPVHVMAKIFVQQLWKNHFDWDQPLPQTLCDEWAIILAELRAVTTDVSINRRYFDTELVSDSDNTYELHVFCDSSSKAYGSIVYLRHKAQTSIVMTKSRVAPTKTVTLPRLELMAALCGAKLVSFVHSSLTPKIQISKCTLWSDSQIVLHWILNNKQLPCFVQNRVNAINACDVITEFRYCNTADNPADLISRGTTTRKLLASDPGLSIACVWTYFTH